MNRSIVTVVLVCGSLGLAEPLRDAYDIIRNGLCAVGLTCNLPADMIFPVGFAPEIAPKVGTSNEIIFAGKPESFTQVFTILAARMSDPKTSAKWPKVFIITPKESRPKLAGWEKPEFKNYVTVINTTDNDAGATFGNLGFSLLMVDSSAVYLPPTPNPQSGAISGVWLSFNGPTVSSIILTAKRTIEIARRGKQREEQSK